MIEIGIIVALIVAILIASYFSRTKLREQRQKKARKGIKELSSLLDLIQRLQRHRGICANLSLNNQADQQALSDDIEKIWQKLLVNDYGGNVKRIRVQNQNWTAIAASPANSFMPHCDLIEKLLHELTVIADICSLTASNNKHDNADLWRNILKRPQFAETLGKLRALGNKAASQKRCSAEVRIQLQYQLLNLRSNSLFDSNTKSIVDLVTNEILSPEVIQIEPRVYFNLLTQAIDQQIELTRNHLDRL